MSPAPREATLRAVAPSLAGMLTTQTVAAMALYTLEGLTLVATWNLLQLTRRRADKPG